MSKIEVGMRLICKNRGALSPITVTELTSRGFKYRLDEVRLLMPGKTFAIDGHEHFGIDGESFYELEK
jgi:hypothetical protein